MTDDTIINIQLNSDLTIEFCTIYQIFIVWLKILKTKLKTPPIIIAHIFSISNHYSTYNIQTTMARMWLSQPTTQYLLCS